MDRRKFITTGAASVTGTVVLTGCLGDQGTSNNGGGSNTETTTTSNDGGSSGSQTTTTSSSGGSSDTQPKIGVLLPFSGTYAWVGGDAMSIIKMIAKEINKQGGINGKDVKLVKGDTEASPTASRSAAEKLINVQNVQGIIGPTSITVSAVTDMFKQNNVPVVSPTAGTRALNNVGGKYIFRTVPSDTLGGRALALAARKKKYNTLQNYSQMALLLGNKEVHQSFKKPISEGFEQLGGTITDTISYATDRQSYSSVVQKMKESNPEISTIISPSDTAIKIFRAAFENNYEGNWFVAQAQVNKEFLKKTEDKLTNDTLGLQSVPFKKALEAGRIKEFQDRHKQFAGKPPGSFSTNTYDAIHVMGLAMKATTAAGQSLTSENVAKNIPKVANPPKSVVKGYTEGAKALENGKDINYRGLTGPINFDDSGDIVAPFGIMQADGNTWKQVARVPPKALKQMMS